jgi:hypothetical protein
MLPKREAGETTLLLMEPREPVAQKYLDYLQWWIWGHYSFKNILDQESYQRSIEHPLPSTHIVASCWYCGKDFKQSLHLNEIFLGLAWGRFVSTISFPQQVHLGDVNFIIKLVNMLHEETFILNW